LKLSATLEEFNWETEQTSCTPRAARHIWRPHAQAGVLLLKTLSMLLTTVKGGIWRSDTLARALQIVCFAFDLNEIAVT